MPENDDTTTEDTDTTTEEDTTAADDAADEPSDDAETFPREYVEKLRKSEAGYRERAGQADALAQRLHTQLVAATGRLADPTDLPFDAAHLDDADALGAALDDLLARKPHLATRRPSGDIGQGAGGVAAGTVDLAGMLRSRT